jgi:hypothetical protein
MSEYALPIFALLVVLVIIIVYLVMKKSEGFMPTATMRMQRLDGLGFEKMDSTAPAATTQTRADSYFAQQQQGGTDSTGISASLTSAQVLASPDFDCANRSAVGNDAWDWQINTAENMSGSRTNPSDNSLSKTLAGY